MTMNLDFLAKDAFISPKGENLNELKSLMMKVMGLVIEHCA